MTQLVKIQVPAIGPAYKGLPVPQRRTAPAVSGWRAAPEQSVAARLYARAGAYASQNGPRFLDIYL
ncbi:MAG: hypothetical protein R3C58_02150 [Parvularculaceae bacterium]